MPFVFASASFLFCFDLLRIFVSLPVSTARPHRPATKKHRQKKRGRLRFVAVYSAWLVAGVLETWNCFSSPFFVCVFFGPVFFLVLSCLIHAASWANAPRWGEGRSSPTTPIYAPKSLFFLRRKFRPAAVHTQPRRPAEGAAVVSLERNTLCVCFCSFFFFVYSIFVCLSICLLARSCLGAARPRCLVAQGVPLSEGNRETGSHWGSHTHAWEWQAHACVASRLPRAEQV
jgi:hypothetical protein